LELRFFREDVYHAWEKACGKTPRTFRDSIPVLLDFPKGTGVAPRGAQDEELAAIGVDTTGISKLPVEYADLRPYAKKAAEIVEWEQEGDCAVCRNAIEHDKGLIAICPSDNCKAVSHLDCLGRHFIDEEKDDTPLASQGDLLLPIQGNCPSCGSNIKWIDVVKEITLRERGQKELAKLLKEPRVKKVKGPKEKKPRGRPRKGTAESTLGVVAASQTSQATGLSSGEESSAEDDEVEVAWDVDLERDADLDTAERSEEEFLDIDPLTQNPVAKSSPIAKFRIPVGSIRSSITRKDAEGEGRGREEIVIEDSDQESWIEVD
jgi:hypothetical protein